MIGPGVTIGAVDDERRLTARLSPDAHDGLLLASRSIGVSVTALIEGAGRLLMKTEGRLEPSILEDLPDVARHIDAERRRRRD